jgi:uncharacterized protein (DUF427 family)
MAIRVRDAMLGHLGELRYEPVDRRLRAYVAGEQVVDTARPALVWEPRRVVPSYGVPPDDLRAQLVPAAAAPPDPAPILHPGIPFAAHATAGEAFDVHAAGRALPAAAFRPSDPAVAGWLILDFDAFDRWLEEDEPVVAHPRDPFHRVDLRRSSRRIRVELDGEVLAETTRATLVFETGLPTRFYLPREDVRAELRPGSKHTQCAYKGDASYHSPVVRGRPVANLGWSYEQPLRDAAPLAGLIAFFDERVDVVVDGERRERPGTAMTSAMLEGVGG